MGHILTVGEPAPWFGAPMLDGNSRYKLDTAGGRWIVMLLMGSGADDASQAALRLLAANRDLFDDEHAAFFGVTVDPADAAHDRIAKKLPGIRWFLDYDHAVSACYGAVGEERGRAVYTPFWLMLDPTLCVHRLSPLSEGSAFFEELRSRLATPFEMLAAPVLVVPNVLSPGLCRELIALYERHGGRESGFMRDVDGVSVEIVNRSHKRRSDHIITDEQVLTTLLPRMSSVLRPMIRRAFQFDANRIERFLIACYDESVKGFFRSHRDNTTKATEHRKFACTINLNAEDYEGGDLCFPEFGARTYRAPTGGAVIFSCSLLHAVRPVTRGRRYAMLPFFYDDEGARIRERNLPFVGPELQAYKSGLPGSVS